jgi:hypothetical protein
VHRLVRLLRALLAPDTDDGADPRTFLATAFLDAASLPELLRISLAITPVLLPLAFSIMVSACA